MEPSPLPPVGRATIAPRAPADDIPKMREMLDAKLIKDINEQPFGTVTMRFSALHFAARNGSEEAVKMLLEHGADPFLNCRDDAKPIETANTLGHYHIGEMLWKKMREMKKPKNGEKFGQLGAWGGAGQPPYNDDEDRGGICMPHNVDPADYVEPEVGL